MTADQQDFSIFLLACFAIAARSVWVVACIKPNWSNGKRLLSSILPFPVIAWSCGLFIDPNINFATTATCGVDA
jgi:hypothetical protein